MDEEFDAFLYQAPVRQSLDTQVNAFGRHLLHLCQASGLHILNGRTTGDTAAQFTSHANAGHTVIDYFIASAHLCNKALHLKVQGIIPSSDHYPVLLTLDMPTTLSVSSASVLPSPNLRYDNSRKESYVAQYIDGDGFFTELGRQLADVQELSAPEGIQLLQDCIMEAAQNTYQKAKSESYQPKDKPFFDDECRVALRQYEDALQDATSHVAKYFLKRFRTVVRRKKRHHTKHTSAKLMDLARHSPAKFWKRFRKKGKSVPIADLDKWMAHFEKLLNVPRSDGYVDSHMFDVHPADLPSAAALNTAIHPDEVLAAITALKRNKSSDLYGMRSEFIIDAASHLASPISAVFNNVFDTSFPASQSIGRLCPIFKGGDEHDLDNYRGITVGTVVSKLYATVLERRISGWAENHEIRAAGQAGFRRDHRTSDNIFIMRTLIEACKATRTSSQHGRL